MYLDKELALCAVSNNVLTAQAETTVDTHVSDSVINLTHVPRTILDNAYFVFQIETAIVSAGGGTLQIDLVCSAAVGLTTPTVLWSTGVLANATIVAWTANSTIYAFKCPAYLPLQYLGCNYTIGTAVFTAGSWRAFFVPDVPFAIPATF
jgi:hypothetical protein